MPPLRLHHDDVHDGDSRKRMDGDSISHQSHGCDAGEGLAKAAVVEWIEGVNHSVGKGKSFSSATLSEGALTETTWTSGGQEAVVVHVIQQ